MNKPKTPHPFRYTYLTRHHILPRERQGTSQPHNILRLWADKHHAWHQIFNSRTIYEILQRFDLYRFYIKRPQWKMIFGDKSMDECRALLYRVARIKRTLKFKH